MKPAPHPGMPSKEQMRRWREGHRQMNRDARLERMQMSYEQRLNALEMLYKFFRSLEYVNFERPDCERWVRYKRKWIQENLS
ncbi:MAG: hypothetical protein NZ556_02400 [Fimbriimonadales bacterium]|nr:hypothetical protein [Fimbriimonadales bacterium]